MEKIRVAINGFGRIGRCFFKRAIEAPELEIVAINDLGNLEDMIYLLKYDSVYRKWEKSVEIKNGNLVVEGKEIKFLQEKNPENLPWKELEIDVAVESTGIFTAFEDAAMHLKAGAKRVVISAPGKKKDPSSEVEGKNILLGINEENLEKYQITATGSCTTNAVSPVFHILNQNLRIKKAFLSTIHAYTSTQNLIDGPHKKDKRRGRAAAQNIIPTSTGAAKCISEIFGISEIFDAIALRVPVICGSVAQLIFLSSRQTSEAEILEILEKESQKPCWQNLLKIEKDPIVSSDIIGDPYPSIVDASSIKVIDKDLVQILIWYDNESGYTTTLVEQVKRVGKLLKT